MPSADAMRLAYQDQLRRSRAGGNAALPETFRLTRVVCALLRLVNADYYRRAGL